DAELDVVSEELRQVRTSPEQLVPIRSAVALRIGGAVLAHPLPPGGPAGPAAAAFPEVEALRPLRGPLDPLRQGAGIGVLRALLALESGDVESAHRHLRAALDVWGGDDKVATGAGVDFLARPIAQQTIRLLEGD